MPAYLKRRHNAWSVRVQVPRHLWAAAGTREYVKALHTTDLKEAERLKYVHLTEFNRRIARLEGAKGDPLRAHYRDALEWHEDFKTADATEENEHGATERDVLRWAATDRAEEIAAQHGMQAAERFLGIVTGQHTFLEDLYPQWLDEAAPPAKRRDLHLVALKSFLAWAGQHVSIEEVDRKKAGEFITFLLDGSRAKATVDRYRSTLSTFWRWLAEKGRAEPERNPWTGHASIKRAGRAKAAVARKGLNDPQLVKLLSGTYSGAGYSQAIADLTRLALATGARLEELGDIKRAHVERRRDGFWLTVEKGKTAAAARVIPVHKSVAPIIARRARGKGAYLFDELKPGPYGRRTHHASKAYGRFRKQVGVGERGADFHALRHTFTGTMEGAGVPLSTIQLLIGHSRRKTMGTTAVYTRGERVNLRKAIDRLRYSARVMRLLDAEQLE